MHFCHKTDFCRKMSPTRKEADFTDFYQIKTKHCGSERSGYDVIYPEFKVCRSQDLLIRGKAFYGIWDEGAGLWSTDINDVVRLVDEDLSKYKEAHPELVDAHVNWMQDFSSGSWLNFNKFVNSLPDIGPTLDDRLTFSNTEVKKKDYVSKRLPYPLEPGEYRAFDEIIGTLYEPEERAKLEWAIGAVVTGDAKKIQKFIVLYGEGGKGKSTILNIVEKLFQGYYTMFDAKALTSNNNQFSTEVFRNHPLVGIQHDGDLSRIEDNTKLNSIVSHENITMNEKFKASYYSRADCFLFMATNKPVKITDSKSGVIRRLIDVRPSGRLIPETRYHALMAQIDFELGAIATHCAEVYRQMGMNYYSAYRPMDMMLQTDVFYNFVEDSYDVFSHEEYVTLAAAYAMYKQFSEESNLEFKMPRYKFRESLKDYFREFYPVTRIDGKQLRSVYIGFLAEKFQIQTPEEETHAFSLVMDSTTSLLDDALADCPAQYATRSGVPASKWSENQTTLKELNTKRIHFVQMPENMVVIDFDLKDENGEKSFEKNLEAASKWPSTYAEFSKSGAGIHLHYYYDGDVSLLSPVYAKDIEVKVQSGNSSLRRRLSKCNNVPVAHINSGLPWKEEVKTVNFDSVNSERGLRDLIVRNLNKEIHGNTKPSVDFIYKILEDAYASGLSYDVTDMRPRILAFANNSSNHAGYCLKLVSQMKFQSDVQNEEDPINEDLGPYREDALYFYDVEVFPNLFIVVCKKQGGTPMTMINPSQADIELLCQYRLVGFNCRRYDNHILYGRLLGYNNEQLYNMSQRIINGSKNAFISEAYSLSYTDVYDFSSKKQSLKKFEIELGIHHQELGLPWDKEVPEELWHKVAEYCVNDVVATEKVFEARHADWTARQILADIAGLSVNDTTNTLTQKIIFRNDRNPQNQFNYRDMGEYTPGVPRDEIPPWMECDENFTVFQNGKPVFPGYTYEFGKSWYRDEDPKEGGYVYAEPGVYGNVALLDIASMHPSSLIAEELFGPVYTPRFQSILDARLAIKHKDYEKARSMLDGKLSKYLDDEGQAKDLAQALKIAINSVYGLTSAKFDNRCRDNRNKDNIVAKRGALFMINLKHEVQNRGFTVAHIKTDSIKIPDATPEIIQFVMDYGKLYGYTFEHEATYERMCLVNDAVYVARYQDTMEWTATGTQFQVPYVFKTLFSHEPLEFRDLCETKTVSTALYLDMNEGLGEDEHNYVFVGKAGSFCPIKQGCGGGELMREKDGKYYAATGSKGYRWLEAEIVENLEKQDDIDYSYYDKLAEDAKAAIHNYGDFDWFVSDAPYVKNDPHILPF